jgi:hypothetical protein
MRNTYIHDLESAFELMMDKNATLEKEKETAEQTLAKNKEYIQNVVLYLSNKLDESNEDIWEVLQDISKLDKRTPVYAKDNKNAVLVTDLVCNKLGFKNKKVA